MNTSKLLERMKNANVVLILGLPGTGKTTFVNGMPDGHKMYMDLGKNATMSEEDRRKFYSKSRKTTTSIMKVIGNLQVYWDTYLEYFDVNEFVNYPNLLVIVALPENSRNTVLERVRKRDGDGEFYNLYKRNFEQWLRSWHNRTEALIDILGLDRVIIVNDYVELTHSLEEIDKDFRKLLFRR